jgi:hypothetical protein
MVPMRYGPANGRARQGRRGRTRSRSAACPGPRTSTLTKWLGGAQPRRNLPEPPGQPSYPRLAPSRSVALVRGPTRSVSLCWLPPGRGGAARGRARRWWRRRRRRRRRQFHRRRRRCRRSSNEVRSGERSGRGEGRGCLMADTHGASFQKPKYGRALDMASRDFSDELWFRTKYTYVRERNTRRSNCFVIVRLVVKWDDAMGLFQVAV